MKDDIGKALRVELLENQNGETSTFMKLIRAAERDGHLTGGAAASQHVMASAHKIADAFDELHPEEKKVFGKPYYEKFIKMIKR